MNLHYSLVIIVPDQRTVYQRYCDNDRVCWTLFKNEIHLPEKLRSLPKETNEKSDEIRAFELDIWPGDRCCDATEHPCHDQQIIFKV